MRKCILSLSILFGLVVFMQAQEDYITEDLQYSILSSDVRAADVGLIPESMDADVNKLMQSWQMQYFSRPDDSCHDDEMNVFYPDSIYRQRLDALPRIIPMTYNPIVRNCIDLYGDRRRSLVRYMLNMADFYFPVIEPILDEYDLPIELKYLAVVESALNPVALSRVGASGMWQFMLHTGKSYGLEINSLEDDRRDPVKATRAACRYFQDMYAIYGDWHLVIASYNCGPGNINKAIRRSGGKRDFWDIFPYLPKETRSYVPLFIAANYIMQYHCEHNLCAARTALPMATDTIMVNRMLHFQQVADMLHIDIELIRMLNPQYKRDIIPGSAYAPRVLKLPAPETYAFIDKEDTIYAHRLDELLCNSLSLNASGSLSKSDKQEKITHVAVSGENLHVIGNIYGVTAANIRKWNGLGSNRVAPGKRLIVYVDNGGVTFASNRSTSRSTANPLAAQAKTETSKPTKTESVAATNKTTSTKQSLESDFVSYKVRSGDTLYKISQKYPGVSTAMLQKANGLSNSNIRPGQVLKIPVG